MLVFCVLGTYLFLYFLQYYPVRERFSQQHAEALFDACEQEKDSLPISPAVRFGCPVLQPLLSWGLSRAPPAGITPQWGAGRFALDGRNPAASLEGAEAPSLANLTPALTSPGQGRAELPARSLLLTPTEGDPSLGGSPAPPASAHPCRGAAFAPQPGDRLILPT